ncbi:MULTISPECIES: phage capsid protein [Lactococcus]|uniref:Phage capsid protein n=1 Tax=Lactococcus garvieae TaxID=1363 RepID=A0AAX3NEU8_9LACT|nr:MULTISPECIES: phage capsid protein [Lactococcus]WEA14884.1 phage capsid protein [Lactococcus garvieae]
MKNEDLLKQMAAITKAGNNVTLRDDNARAFVMDMTGSQATLAKLFVHFAKSGTGTIDKLGVKRRNLKLHQGTNTTPAGTDIKTEKSVKFTLTDLYLDTWIENSNTFYTARTRGQDVRQALLSLMQSQFGADLQDLAFNGDEDSDDPFLKLNNGFIKQAKTDAAVKVEGNALPTIQELTTKVVGKIESKYLNSTFKWHMSNATAAHYVAEIQNRETVLGDSAIVNGTLTNIAGYGVEIVDSMDNDVLLFTPYENLANVLGLDVTLTTAVQDSTSVAKQATYHFMLSAVDFIIRENNMIGYVGLVTP